MIGVVIHMLLSGIFIVGEWGALSQLGGRSKKVATTIVGHAFWKEEPGPTRESHVIQFLTNLRID